MSHFRTGIKSLRRAPFQAIAAISVLAVTFFVSTLLVLLAYSSNKVLRHFETRPQIIAFLKDDVEADDVSTLQKKLEGDSRVSQVDYVSKESALEIYKGATVDNPLLGELVSPSIFPASLEFSVSDLSFAEELVSEVKDEEVVESVAFTANLGGESALGDVISRLKTITLYIRVGGLVAMALLAATSLLVLMVIVGMRITVQRREVESLSLLGAGRWFIRAPIMIEAIMYSFMGVIIGWTAALVLVMYATPGVISYFGQIPVLPRDTFFFFGLFGIIFAGELLMGVIIATFGSYIAISRSLGRK
jgi:cell division transport system permease protein